MRTVGKTVRLPLFILACLLVSFGFNLPTFAGEQNRIRVALFLDAGAHPRQGLQDAISSANDMSLAFVDGNDIRQGCLRNFDLLLVPGGRGRVQGRSIAASGRDEIRRFVNDGGLYIGICAGAYLASSAREGYLGLLPFGTRDGKHWHRGKAFLPIELTPLGNEIFGYPQQKARVLYHNGPILNAGEDLEVQPLSFFRGEIVAPEGDPGVMKDNAAMLLAKYGRGLVIAISPHPEASPGLGKFVPNAIRWMYAHRSQ